MKQFLIEGDHLINISPEMKARAEARRSKITYNVVDLHDEINHNSFHIGLSTIDAWEHLMELSRLEYTRKTGIVPPIRMDRTKIRIISKEQKDKEYDDSFN